MRNHQMVSKTDNTYPSANVALDEAGEIVLSAHGLMVNGEFLVRVLTAHHGEYGAVILANFSMVKVHMGATQRSVSWVDLHHAFEFAANTWDLWAPKVEWVVRNAP